jgi:hypothetical protein
VRIRVDGIDQKVISSLIEKLEIELDQDSFGRSEEAGDWDDEKVSKKEFEWSEGYVTRETIFGVDCIKISGDAPYNFGEEIGTVIDRFIENADTEWSEP